MSFFEDASLVYIPAAVKTGKTYSIKPTDGSGDLTFTRNSNATRVNADGLVEKVRTNLALYSQYFSSGAWLVLNSTKVSTANTDPNGGSTACNVTWGAGTNAFLYQSLAQTGYYTVSMWVKSNGGGNNFRLFGDGTASYSANFTATSSWQRFSFTFNAAGGSSWGISHNSTQDAANLLVAFAQLEVSDFGPTQYIPTTSAAVSVGPTANVPRLDYSGDCPSLLLEPQRTNSALYSEQTDNAYWLKYQCSTTANQAVSPDGFQNADLFTLSASGTGVIYKTGITAGALSFFAKAATLSANAKFYISVDGVGSASWNQDGTLNEVTGGTATDGISYGNEWYRFNLNVTSGSVINYGLAYATSGDSAYIWGLQNEASASYATSYIPTLGASVTRLADAAYKTGIASLIGQTEGTFFTEFKLDGIRTSAVIAYITDGTTSNAVIAQYTSGGLLQVVLNSGGTTYVNIVGSASAAGSYKLAIAYKLNDVIVYLNGASVGTDTSATMPVSMSRLDIAQSSGGSAQLGGAVKQALLFKTRLSNADLETLTTL